MDYTLIDLETVLLKMGRGVVLYAHDGTPSAIGAPIGWDGASPLQLAHLGDTEGDITFTPNESVATLTRPELSGEAIHEADALGPNPTLEVPLLLADPDLRSILSPTGLKGAGHFRVRPVAERTVVVFPERLFQDSAGAFQTLAFSGGAWTLNGSPLTSAQETDLDNSLWIWKCYIDRPNHTFLGGHGDDGKNIGSVMVHPMMHPDIPDGQRLFTIGDPADVSIDIEGGS